MRPNDIAFQRFLIERKAGAGGMGTVYRALDTITNEPVALPKGARIECTAHFDNSANNPENADPTKEVSWGEQSWDEMMVGFFNVVFDAKMPVENLFVDRKNNAGIAKN